MKTADDHKNLVGKKIRLSGAVYTLAGVTADKSACAQWPMYGFNDAVPNGAARYFTLAEIKTAK